MTKPAQHQMKRVNQFLRQDQIAGLERLARTTPDANKSEHMRRAVDSYLKRFARRLSA